MAFVKTEVQGAVEIITIDRPKALNALNPEVLADLKAAFEAVDQSAIRCIVLTGEGDKSFVAGADIGSMSTMTKAEGEAFGKLGNDVFLMIESFPIPVIAAVNGFALGGGNELAMSCDIRICSDNAVFGQPEVGLGNTASPHRTAGNPHIILLLLIHFPRSEAAPGHPRRDLQSCGLSGFPDSPRSPSHLRFLFSDHGTARQNGQFL